MFTFPVTVLEFDSMVKQRFDDGLIDFGTVQQIDSEGDIHYAILDGGWWSHPGLKPFLGRSIGINLNIAEHQLEVMAWPNYTKRLAILQREDWLN